MNKIIMLFLLLSIFSCGGGGSSGSSPKYVTPELSVTASAENNSARLSWSVAFSPEEKVNFIVYLGYEIIHREDGISHYDINNLQPNRVYEGRVVATGLNSKSSATAYFSFKTLGGPLVPLNAKVNPGASRSIDVLWQAASSSGAEEVVYDVSLDGRVLSANATDRSLKLSDLVVDKEYAVAIGATDSRGNKISSRISFILMPAGDVLSNYEINVSGALRRYGMFLPENAENKKLPLVIWLHGAGMEVWPYMVDDYWVRLASREKFYVLQPQALKDSFGNSNYWAAGISKERDDVDFIKEMLNLVENQYDIDTDRIYISGFSSGGDMAYYSAQALEDRLAAIAPVAGVVWNYILYPEPAPNGPWFSYKLKRPMPLCSIWGTADNVYSYNGSDAHVGWHDILGFWSKLNNVEPLPVRSINLPDVNAGDESRVVKHEFRGANISSDIDSYVVENGSHTVPGITRIYGRLPGPLNTGPTNEDINSYEVIWEFFKKHKLSDRM